VLGRLIIFLYASIRLCEATESQISLNEIPVQGACSDIKLRRSSQQRPYCSGFDRHCSAANHAHTLAYERLARQYYATITRNAPASHTDMRSASIALTFLYTVTFSDQHGRPCRIRPCFRYSLAWCVISAGPVWSRNSSTWWCTNGVNTFACIALRVGALLQGHCTSNRIKAAAPSDSSCIGWYLYFDSVATRRG
jgi:hypothetical protein